MQFYGLRKYPTETEKYGSQIREMHTAISEKYILQKPSGLFSPTPVSHARQSGAAAASLEGCIFSWNSIRSGPHF